MGKTVSNAIMRNMLANMANQGIDTRPILQQFGVLPEELLRPEGRIAAPQHYRFMQSYCSFLVDEALAQQLVSYMYQDYPEFIGLCMNSASIDLAIEHYIRYRELVGQCDQIWAQRLDPHRVVVSYVNEGPSQLGSTQALYNFIILAQLCRQYQPEVRFELEVAEARRLEYLPIADIFQTRPQWQTGFNRLLIQWPETQSASGYNLRLAELQQGRLVQLLRQLHSESSLAGRVGQLIRHQLLQSDFRTDDGLQERVCQGLSMSRWTLNRHLQAEHVTFQSILDRVRMDLACQLLRDSEDSLQRISERLGFASQCSFSRFFRQHLLLNPSQYRKNG